MKQKPPAWPEVFACRIAEAWSGPRVSGAPERRQTVPGLHAGTVDQLADGHAENRRRYQGNRQDGDVGPGQSFLDGHENHSSLIVRLIIPQKAAAVVK